MTKTSYYVNETAQDNGDHEVHKAGCSWLVLVHRKKYLGEFSTCHAGVAEAQSQGYNANGCYHCSRPCHTG